ncbi:MAG: TonB-dependent receptor [Chitinivibrionales bacterium]|nr:TonB-dependent receptor [Chitinivibrionales bacterium]MBD3356994.1 TonB-dependent receptor [Chitinivibrionales bacterium]
MRNYAMRFLHVQITFNVLMCAAVALAGAIRGVVTDSYNTPLDSVKVTVEDAAIATYTDASGLFTLECADTGQVGLTFSAKDFISESISVRCVGSDTSLMVRMESAIRVLEKMTVVATSAPSRLEEISRTVSVKGEEELKNTHAQSLGDALKDMPGVQLAEQGPNVTKPVIRGMTNQRIVLVRDGSRHEAQQWSNHHTPEVDIADASRIEVLRGPGSLLYGSGALGGVVLVKSPPIRTSRDGARPVGADVAYQFFSNSEQHAGHVGLHGAWPWGAWRIDASGRNAPHFAVPGENHFLAKQAAGEVSDSVPTEFAGFKQYNFRVITGISKEKYEITLRGTHYWEEQKLIGEGHWHNSGGPAGGPWYHVGEPILSPTLHQKLQINTKLFAGNHTFTFDIAGQHDHRRGIPGSIGVQVDLKNYFATSNGRWRHAFNPKFPGTVGVNISRKHDRTGGVEVLIPDHNTTYAGLFLLQELRLTETFTGSIGLRGDIRDYEIFQTRMTEGFRPYIPTTLRGTTVDSIPSLFVEGADRMAVPSFSVGFSWKPRPLPFSVAGNFGTGFRLPEPNELAILGAHHGSYEYLVGLAVTDPREGSIIIDDIASFRETAYNSDLIFRSSHKHINTECALFYNRLVDYIYAKPTGEFIRFSRISALPVKEYVRTNAHVYGMELFGSVAPLSGLSLELGFDITVGEILDDVFDSDEDGEVERWLPGVQPPRLIGGISFGRRFVSSKWIENASLSFGAEGYLAQNRLAEFENVLRKDSHDNNVLFPPESYVLFNAGAQVELILFSNVSTISIEGKNLLNTEYTSHLSNYKGIAKNPGFDVSIKASISL